MASISISKMSRIPILKSIVENSRIPSLENSFKEMVSIA